MERSNFQNHELITITIDPNRSEGGTGMAATLYFRGRCFADIDRMMSLPDADSKSASVSPTGQRERVAMTLDGFEQILLTQRALAGARADFDQVRGR